MSNEEQAVLDFFSQQENLPLGLSVAEQMDEIRLQMNNAFWKSLLENFVVLLKTNRLPWSVETTSDRNSDDCLVGLYLQPLSEQAQFLRLMMEQQHLGNTLRIYYGVMWNTPPSSDNLLLPEVLSLRETLLAEGFKSNESFLAWNWTNYHPRRRDFLQRYSSESSVLLAEARELLGHLLQHHAAVLNAANTALCDRPRSVTVSLDQLRSKITR